MNDPILFALAVATLLATPGPTNTLMATAGALQGPRAALHLLAAELSAYLISIVTIRQVLSPLLHQYPLIGTGTKLLVAAYLIWLSIKLWRQKSITAGEGRAVSFGNVFVTTLLNPKALIFALTLIPRENDGVLVYFAGFAGLVLLAGTGWILLGAGLRMASGSAQRLLPRVAAVVLTGFAGLIAASAL